MRGKLILSYLAILTGLWASVSAQNDATRLIVNVPFRFHLGERTYESGVYSFSPQRDVLVVGKSDGTTQARILANPVLGRVQGKSGQAVFHCYGRECFLSQVWLPDRYEGIRLMRSRLETELAHRRETGVYMALVASETKP